MSSVEKCIYFGVSLGAIAVNNGLFSDRNVLPSIGDVQCLGSELELLNCSYSNSPDSSCVERDDAGVACQGKPLLFVDVSLFTL